MTACYHANLRLIHPEDAFQPPLIEVNPWDISSLNQRQTSYGKRMMRVQYGSNVDEVGIVAIYPEEMGRREVGTSQEEEALLRSSGHLKASKAVILRIENMLMVRTQKMLEDLVYDMTTQSLIRASQAVIFRIENVLRGSSGHLKASKAVISRIDNMLMVRTQKKLEDLV
ncbi:hypothetical protein FF38_00389 [Lucilia cuprina]|uniref:Uncharacterized protein n=1 Tax=Lucilia cuprina TaxID=7375 RepID=A0A0L0C9V9_LUCCU|nr:hypothetical protein FF38_00389 [Lucilia cuprina]